MIQFFDNTDFFGAEVMTRDISSNDTTLNLTFHEKSQIKSFDLAGPCSPDLSD